MWDGSIWINNIFALAYVFFEFCFKNYLNKLLIRLVLFINELPVKVHFRFDLAILKIHYFTIVFTILTHFLYYLWVFSFPKTLIILLNIIFLNKSMSCFYYIAPLLMLIMSGVRVIYWNKATIYTVIEVFSIHCQRQVSWNSLELLVFYLLCNKMNIFILI